MKIPEIPIEAQKRIDLEVKYYGYPTIEDDIQLGLDGGYPECCIEYFIRSRIYPDLPRYVRKKYRKEEPWMPCPECAKMIEVKPAYTWNEAGEILRPALEAFKTKLLELNIDELKSLMKEFDVTEKQKYDRS